jgi:hypothetical protein
MAIFSRRPVSLAHVSDEQAARALSRRFGAIKQAAEDLGVDPKHLRRLIWSNPAILDAANERQSLFASVRRDEIIRGLTSKAASVRRRAADRMFANPGLFGDLQHPLLPATRPRRGPSAEARAQLARERLDREAAAEFERERAVEIEREREREAAATVVAIKPPRALQPQPVSLWPTWIRRPSRGRRWR